MADPREVRIRELEARLRVLENENEMLIERAEETLLLRWVSDTIAPASEPIEVLEAALERIAVLRAIPFCAAYAIRADGLDVLASHVTLADGEDLARRLDLSPALREQLGQGPCLRSVEEGDIGELRFGPPAGFQPLAALLVPFSCSLAPEGCFVFATDERPAERLASTSLLLQQIVDLVRGKLEHLHLLRELRRANAELEQRVAQRTAELARANRELRREAAVRERAERELRASEERYRSMFEQAAVGIVRIDRGGRIVQLNPRFLSWVGLPEEELVGRRFEEWIEPEDLAAALPRLRAALEGRDPGALELRGRRSDGSRVWLRVSVSLVRDPEGSPREWIAIVEDIDETRRAEARAREAERMEAIERLAGGFAHGFNNLLLPVLGYSEMVMSQLPPGDPRRDDLARLREAAEKAKELTQRILAFARRQPLRLKRVRLAELVEEAAASLRTLLRPGTRLELDLDEDGGWVEADVAQIEQALMSLVLNAQEAMPQGGEIRIELREESGTEGRQHEAEPDPGEGAEVVLRVRDTGLGMEEDTVAQAFEPFFTTKEPRPGAGLGLSTVRGIVERHGGRVRIVSRPHRGTTVELRFPPAAVGRPEAAGERSRRPAAGAPPSPTALVVERDPSVRRLVGRLLAEAGLQVLEAAGGREALAVASEPQRRLDLLVADTVTLGGELGGLIGALRERFPALPALLLAEMARPLPGNDLGSDPKLVLLPKPFPRDLFLLRVRELMERPAGG